MKHQIKYMVSHRCKLAVKEALEKMGIKLWAIELGEVTINEDLSSKELATFKKSLLQIGLELLEDKKAQLIDRIKILIIDKIHSANFESHTNFTKYLSEELEMDYKILAGQFSEITRLTIEQFIILHKIEKVKELLLYDELTLTQISYKLDYSSVAHLSAQFKKITSLTPTYFKVLKNHRMRLNLECI